MFIVYCKLTEKCVNDLILSYSATFSGAETLTNSGTLVSI